MADLKVKTHHGGHTTVADHSLNSLRRSFRGELLTPGSTGYDTARTIWNGMIDRRPALIARCVNATDVVQAIQLAGEHGMVVAVRGGGHNIAGNAVCDGGLMIDLSPMKLVQVDQGRRIARVEPGVTLGEFDAQTQAYGLATPVGINSTTGIAGLTLGGGFGWLSRSLGLTIDNLLAADVVTANGELIRASEDEHPDLFWAIRGGGGNFGVVTAFEFRLHPVGPEVLAGLIIHPLENAREVLHYYRKFVATTPEKFACWFVMRKAPPLPFLAPEWHGREILALAACYSGDIEEGEKIARPLRDFGKPIADIIQPMPFTAWQQVLDPLLTPGKRNYWKSHDFAELSDGLIDTLIDFAKRIPNPQTEIAFAQLGGAVKRVPDDATAYGHRNGEYVLNVHGRWDDAAQDEECIGWARELFRAAGPYSTGSVYVNFLTQEEGDRVRAAYGANYDRLAGIKHRYDPDNLFRLCMNIRPEADRSGSRRAEGKRERPRDYPTA